MNRREFIRRTALLSAYALSRSSLPARAEENAQHVIIIGAGIAGLGAARALRQKGWQATVLEARDRIGGRIWTSRLWKNMSLDLGASWIHGTQRNPISQLAHEFGADTLPTDSDRASLYGPDGRLVATEDQAVVYDRFEKIVGDLKMKRGGLERDRSVKHALDEAVKSAGLTGAELDAFNFAVNSEIEHVYAADVEDLSFPHWDTGKEFRGGDVLIRLGFDQITNGLAKDLDIKLRHVVTKIEHGPDGVTVTTDQAAFKADRVLVTVPLGVLRSGGITFLPALPEQKTDALQRLRMGTLNKCYLRFREMFWEEDDHWIGHIPKKRGEWTEFLNLYPLIRKSVLLGFNAGSFGKQLESMTDEEIVQSVMTVLRKMYGGSIPEPEVALITRWASDPFSLGSYSHIPVGSSPKDMAELAKPVGGRLFFAGEHTSEYYATVHGAYLSGLRAAAEISHQ